MGKSRKSANLVSENNITSDIDNRRVGICQTTPGYMLDVNGDINFIGDLRQNGALYTPDAAYAPLAGYSTSAGISTYATSAGIATYATTAGVATVATNAQGLTGTPDITVGAITGASATFSGSVSIGGTLTYEDVNNVDSVGLVTARSGIDAIGVITARSDLNVAGVTTSNQTRFLSVAERVVRVDGNTVNISYTSTGSNIGLCTNPSGDITLAVTGIPTDSTFDDHAISFSVFITQTGTARSCTAVTLNGVTPQIRWVGGSFDAAVTGVTTSSGFDIFNFIGINTVGSASTTANYDVLGAVNGGFN